MINILQILRISLIIIGCCLMLIGFLIKNFIIAITGNIMVMIVLVIVTLVWFFRFLDYKDDWMV